MREIGMELELTQTTVRVSSRPADAAIARLIQGTKVLTPGGPDKLFQQTFGGFLGEKLLQPCACYISTNAGLLIGTLYISTKRLAFCSDSLLCHHPFSQQQHECVYYKMLSSVGLELMHDFGKTEMAASPGIIFDILNSKVNLSRLIYRSTWIDVQNFSGKLNT
ncbi:GEM-like protein 1 [Glycine soja]